jgi:hypothetical protein
MRPAVIDRLRKPVLTDPAVEEMQIMAAPAPAKGPGPAKLDPLVEALGLAVARNAIRDRTLSAA